ncbi:MAG: hypothetical protein K6C13_01640 [Oscillospiraceae bacterium]|nr:hypothetical protein [Oscillospiraceae bacterium]
MEYNDVEKEFLDLLNRSDFKHLSRNDVITYASKLNELRPEVAAQVIAQYPEFVKLIQSSLSEYRAVLEKIIQSDDGSVEKVYDTADKELDISAESRRLFYETARKALDHCEKCFDSASSPEERMQIRDQEIEILRMIDKKDSEIRNAEMEAVKIVDEKDSEKRAFNWKAIAAVSTVLVTIIGIGGAMLGGNFNLKLPKK